MKRLLASCLSVALLNASLVEGWAAAVKEVVPSVPGLPAQDAALPGVLPQATLPEVAASPGLAAPAAGPASIAAQAPVMAPALASPAVAQPPAALVAAPLAEKVWKYAEARGFLRLEPEAELSEEAAEARFRAAIELFDTHRAEWGGEEPAAEAAVLGGALDFAAAHAADRPHAPEVRLAVLNVTLREKLAGVYGEPAAPEAARHLGEALGAPLDLTAAKAADVASSALAGGGVVGGFGALFLGQGLWLLSSPAVGFIGSLLITIGATLLLGTIPIALDAFRHPDKRAWDSARAYEGRHGRLKALRKERRRALARLRRAAPGAAEPLLERLAVLQAKLLSLGKDRAGLKQLARAAAVVAGARPAEVREGYRISARAPADEVRARVRVKIEETLRDEGASLSAEDEAALEEALLSEAAAETRARRR